MRPEWNWAPNRSRSKTSTTAAASTAALASCGPRGPVSASRRAPATAAPQAANTHNSGQVRRIQSSAWAGGMTRP